MPNYKFNVPVQIMMTDDPLYGSAGSGGGLQFELDADDFEQAKAKFQAALLEGTDVTIAFLQ